MELQTISIKVFLSRKGISFRESGKELIAHCLFNGCDKDSRGSEAHLYFDAETGQYECKKCGEKGNIFTLAKHFGDNIQEIALNPRISTKKPSGTKFDAGLVETCHQALPSHIRQYLNARGITDVVIDAHKLGWGKFYGKQWITIPIPDIYGAFQFFKLRQDPSAGNEKITYPKGIEAQLYDWETLTNLNNPLVICEGELDRLALVSKGILAVTSTHGAMTFKKEWLEKVGKGGKIYICYDNDEAGKKGAERVAKMVENGGNETYIITLPQEVGEGGDITDYLVKLNCNPDDLFGKYAKKLSDWEKSGRIKKVAKPEREMDFEEWQKTISDNFPELLFASEVGLSIIAQILIKEITNPFALVLVDVPSAGKTITINFFSEIDELTYASDKFTPASFVSNASNVKKEKLPEIDLLPRLKHKMFLIRDLSTIFSKRDDDLNECLGLLTRVLDGEGLNTDSGIHGQRQYVGEYLFMILAGSTPIPPRVWKMMGNLGSRLFFLSMGSKEKTEAELVEQLTTLAYKEKEKICRIATKNFLYTLWSKYPDGVDWDKSADKQEDKTIIARCARLLAKLRGVINVWKDRAQFGEEYEHTMPVVELASRINQLFYNLCRGHALVCGRTQMNHDDLRLIVELAIDSAPTIRAKLFRKLLEHNGTMKTGEVMAALNCSRPTALKEMEALKILDVCHIAQEGYGEAGEDRQILSLDDQKRELEDIERKDNLKIVERFLGSEKGESQTAHKRGRPIFNHIMQQIEAGKANGLLVWHPNRIARNAFDGGLVITLMDEGKLAEIRTAHRSYRNTPDDKFFLQLEFGMAKKSSDDSSVAVKRGLKTKLQMGWYPSRAPLGYKNTIIKDNVHHYVYYRCTKRKDENCPEKTIELGELNFKIDMLVKTLTISEKFKNWAIAYLHEIRQNEAVSNQSILETKQKSLARVTDQLQNLLLKYTSPENANEELMTAQELQMVKSSLLKDKAALEKDLKEQGKTIEEWAELSVRTFNFARYARMWFANGTMETKRAVFAALGSHLIIQDQKLNVELHPYFKIIFEGVEKAERELIKVRTSEKPTNKRQIATVMAKCPTLRRVQDSNL